MSTKIVAARLATSAGVTTVITRSSNPGNIVKIVKHIQASRSPPSLATKANQTAESTADTQQQQQNAAGLLLRSASSTTLAPDSRSGTPAPESRTTIPLHTRFLPSPHPVRDRYFWILHGLRPHGTLYIDQGAYKALLGKAGLLPVGVVDVEGVFAQQEAVRLCVVDRKTKRRTPPEVGEDSHDGGGKVWEGTAHEVGRALTNYSSVEIARIKGHQSTEIEGILGYADSEYVAPRESISFFAGVPGVRESRPATPVREVVDGRGIGGYEAEGAVL
jgi:glutamate 5-kinase